MTSPQVATARRIALAGAGLVLVLAQAGCGGHGGSRMTAPATPELTTVARTVPQAPEAGPVTISSPAFADGAPIPVRYTCKGADTAPPLTWSAPLGAALVVDDPDAVGGTYIHWIVVGIPPGTGATAAGQTPDGASSLPNSGGRTGYTGPCPPSGSGVHHYRFTLYQLPASHDLTGDVGGLRAAQTIAGAAVTQAQLTGRFGA
ncbi:YbhB/YbcL family Raf kinase inhibitor-like protein [Mycobacterium sp. THU-M104]|uniref:YbhB/YbcL family Raf kinase inhibitor-like protein n=1 Tax=Mycobacterium sp. THU-M104 TaxID=3410515 RepID=UPI003B9D5A7F